MILCVIRFDCCIGQLGDFDIQEHPVNFIASNCKQIKELFPGTATDGDYYIQHKNNFLLVYCHAMQTLVPKEYISLNPKESASLGNLGYYQCGAQCRSRYSRSLPEKAIQYHNECGGVLPPTPPPICNTRPEIPRIEASSNVRTIYDKVRIRLYDLSIDITDTTFARSFGKVATSRGNSNDFNIDYIPFGVVGIFDNSDTCTSEDCITAIGGIDLEGTGLELHEDQQWEGWNGSTGAFTKNKGGGIVTVHSRSPGSKVDSMYGPKGFSRDPNIFLKASRKKPQFLIRLQFASRPPPFQEESKQPSHVITTTTWLVAEPGKSCTDECVNRGMTCDNNISKWPNSFPELVQRLWDITAAPPAQSNPCVTFQQAQAKDDILSSPALWYNKQSCTWTNSMGEDGDAQCEATPPKKSKMQRFCPCVCNNDYTDSDVPNNDWIKPTLDV